MYSINFLKVSNSDFMRRVAISLRSFRGCQRLQDPLDCCRKQRNERVATLRRMSNGYNPPSQVHYLGYALTAYVGFVVVHFMSNRVLFGIEPGERLTTTGRSKNFEMP